MTGSNMASEFTLSPKPQPGPPLWLLAEVTYACPLHCPYCSNPTELGEKADEIDTQTWLDTFSQARELGAVQLGFSGGEPLLRQDLEVMVKHAADLGFYTNLITSGIGLTEKRIKALKDAGLAHIQLSFQGASPDINDLVGQRKHSFAHKQKIARLVKQYEYPMVLNFCITATNIHEIEDILALATELQADFVELATVQYYGWAYLNRDELLPTRDQLLEAEAKVNAYRDAQDGGPKFIFVTPDYYETRPKACMNGWGSTFLTVTPDGTALPCHSARMLPLQFPNVKDTSVAEIWTGDNDFAYFRGDDWMPNPCKTCDEKDKDFGGCRCQAYMLTGDMHKTDPVCDKSPDHHLIQAAIAKAGQSQKALVYRDPKNAIPIAIAES